MSEKVNDSSENATPKHGYVLLYRSVFSNSTFKSLPEALAFIYLIAKAAWRDRVSDYKGKEIPLQRGQMAVSVRDLARKLEWTRTRTANYLKRLETRTMIRTEGGQGVNVITILNYDKYQASEGTARTDDGQGPSHEGGQHADTEEVSKTNTKLNSKNNDPADAAENRYLFEGKIVKLRKPDFDGWCVAFSEGDPARLRALLQERDDWLTQEADEKTKKRWYISTSSWLRKRSGETAARSGERRKTTSVTMEDCERINRQYLVEAEKRAAERDAT